MRKKVALILGGGGAKSFVHLGVISVFQKENIPIDLLVTCSAGSIIGALIANKIPIEEIKKEFFSVVTRLNWLRVELKEKGLLSQKNIKSILKNLGVKKNIEDADIPIRIVATNLSLGKLHIFKEGNIIKAVCASAAFPGIYKPVKIGNYYYNDGGVLDATPADIGRKEIGPDNLVITINLDGKLGEKFDVDSVFQVVHRSIYIPLIHLRRSIVEKNSDVIIEPFEDSELDLKTWADMLRFYSKEKMEYFFELGVEKAQKKIDEIKALL